jgi:hypothetical protein
VLTGVKFVAVKKDVYMQMDLRPLGEAKARALVSNEPDLSGVIGAPALRARSCLFFSRAGLPAGTA